MPPTRGPPGHPAGNVADVDSPTSTVSAALRVPPPTPTEHRGRRHQLHLLLTHHLPGAGLVTSTTDTQCLAYHYAQRLTTAWTGIDHCAATPTASDTSTAGDRPTQIGHDTTGVTANDTATTIAIHDYTAAAGRPESPGTRRSTPSASANSTVADLQW